MAWKKGRMNVEAAKRRHVEHGARQDLPVGHDDGDFCSERRQFLDRVPDFGRLDHGDACGERSHFDLWRGKRLFPADRFVRLRDHADHLMLGCVEQPLQ